MNILINDQNPKISQSQQKADKAWQSSFALHQQLRAVWEAPAVPALGSPELQASLRLERHGKGRRNERPHPNPPRRRGQ